MVSKVRRPKEAGSANTSGATVGCEAQLWRMADARQPTIGQVAGEAIARTAPFGYPVN